MLSKLAPLAKLGVDTVDKLVENFEALAKLSLKEGNEKKSDVATDKEKNDISSLLYTCKNAMFQTLQSGCRNLSSTRIKVD